MTENFGDLSANLAEIKTQPSEFVRVKNINTHLLELIEKAPSPSFLLPAITDFIETVNREIPLSKPYHFNDFELWLNQTVEGEKNLQIRGKIAGKWIPREEYQVFFPIGMGKVFEGTHFVAGHFSPDLDTTVASLWGFVDAFAARVGSGLHIWSLPGGPPNSPVTHLLQEKLGKGLFTSIARDLQALTLSSKDLLSQKNVIKKTAEILVNQLDHGIRDKAVLLVDEGGHYLGDWRSSDVELVRQVIVLYKACLSWFKNHIHVELISLFAKSNLQANKTEHAVETIFRKPLFESEPAKEFDEQETQLLGDFLKKVLKVNGETFLDLTKALGGDFHAFYLQLKEMGKTDLFDPQGKIKENRPVIFEYLKGQVSALDRAIESLRNFVERLDIQMQIKELVLGHSPEYLTLQNDVEDIRLKMQNYSHLTVVFPNSDGKLFPLGVVRASDLRKSVLGTVTFRDFCNFDEVKMASYLSVISVVDHHKTTLNTNSVPMALVGDAQSSNVLVAEQAFVINDRYSTRGASKESLESQLQNLDKREFQLKQNLLQRLLANETDPKYFIHPKREYEEYLFFLHAILDDTDLLTKVSNRDVICVASLLNRLQSLKEKKEVIVLSLDAIPKNEHFAKTAAAKILQTPEMYAFYDKTYRLKEREVQTTLESGDFSSLFSDTKEQNGCCRVGQTKLFSANFPSFEKNAEKIRQEWLKRAKQIFSQKQEIDLHLHMISTIASSEEVFHGKMEAYPHKDEIWFWVPETAQSFGHLAGFLSAFQNSPEVKENELELELIGPNSEELGRIFARNFIKIPQKMGDSQSYDEPIAILRFKAGTINSRKSMISPYLPHLIH